MIFSVEVGDPKAEHAQAEVIGIVSSKRLGEGFACSVDPVRPNGQFGTRNETLFLIHPGNVFRAGKNDGLHTVQSRGLVDIVAGLHVYVERILRH